MEVYLAMVYSADFCTYDFSSQPLKFIYHVFSFRRSNRESLWSTYA